MARGGGPKVTRQFLGKIRGINGGLPSPFVLFTKLTILIVVISTVFDTFKTAIIRPKSKRRLRIGGLTSTRNLGFVLASVLSGFAKFTPLNLILSVVLKVNLTRGINVLSCTVGGAVLGSPPTLVACAIIFINVVKGVTSSTTVILIPPLTTVIFCGVNHGPVTNLTTKCTSTNTKFATGLLVTKASTLLTKVSARTTGVVSRGVIIAPVSG